MIIAIKAVVNYQTIMQSIDDVQYNISRTQEHTDYINNFLIPYLNSDYAEYFLAHENNQLLPGERVIKITKVESETLLEDEDTITTTKPKTISAPEPHQSWNIFLRELVKNIVWRK